ncbi:ty3-gypsy retrotransposon protein [Tanacetum coccineum]
MDEQSHYKQDKTITRQSINVKRHIFDVIGGTEEFEELSQKTIEPHVSLNVYHGSNWVATIHLSGSINGTKVKVLLDGGSSDNFIQPQVAKHVCLPIKSPETFREMVGSATDAIIEAYTIHCFSMDSTQDDTLKLPDTIPHDLASVLHGFTIVFLVPTRLPPSRTQDHSIVLHEGINAVKVLLYLYPVSQKAQIETMVADMLAQGLIQPSSSPFSAPALLVQKKDGTWHFCTGYRALNGVTIKDSFSMPRVDKLLDELHGSQFFRNHRLYAKLSKCAFGQERTEYLGHVVTGAGEMDPAKVIAVANWPIPTSVSQLRAFLGLTGYYRRFIKQYASIANLLTTLIQKNNFKWSHEAQSAFETLKQALQTSPVLVLPDFSKLFIVETDAIGHGIGAIISQSGHPIAFFSKLSCKMQEASTYVRELLLSLKQ